MKGYGAGLMYGISDTVNLGLSTYWAVLHIRIDPVFSPGTSDQIGVVTLDDFYSILEMLGRTRPVTKYDSDPVDFGDTVIDLKWNNYRKKYVSTAVHASLVTPTAHQADPQKNMIFGLGPDIDTGAGTWGGILGGVIDFRLPEPAKFLTFTFGVDGAYYLPDKRPAPQFPDLVQDVKDYLSSQGIDVNIFPDLSDTGDYYYYTPGPWVAFSGGISLLIGSITYRHGFAGSANYDSDSEGFKDLVDSIGLVGYGDDGKIVVNSNIPLTPLYIPGLINFQFEYVTDGRNAMVFRDIYQIGMGIGIPLNVPDRYKMGGGK